MLPPSPDVTARPAPSDGGRSSPSITRHPRVLCRTHKGERAVTGSAYVPFPLGPRHVAMGLRGLAAWPAGGSCCCRTDLVPCLTPGRLLLSVTRSCFLSRGQDEGGRKSAVPWRPRGLRPGMALMLASEHQRNAAVRAAGPCRPPHPPVTPHPHPRPPPPRRPCWSRVLLTAAESCPWRGHAAPSQGSEGMPRGPLFKKQTL